MNATSVAGSALTLAGFAGYVVGVVAPYPGRAFSVSGVMVGITLLAIGAGGGSTGRDVDSDGRGGDAQ